MTDLAARSLKNQISQPADMPDVCRACVPVGHGHGLQQNSSLTGRIGKAATIKQVAQTIVAASSHDRNSGEGLACAVVGGSSSSSYAGSWVPHATNPASNQLLDDTRSTAPPAGTLPLKAALIARTPAFAEHGNQQEATSCSGTKISSGLKTSPERTQTDTVLTALLQEQPTQIRATAFNQLVSPGVLRPQLQSQGPRSTPGFVPLTGGHNGQQQQQQQPGVGTLRSSGSDSRNIIGFLETSRRLAFGQSHSVSGAPPEPGGASASLNRQNLWASQVQPVPLVSAHMGHGQLSHGHQHPRTVLAGPVPLHAMLQQHPPSVPEDAPQSQHDMPATEARNSGRVVGRATKPSTVATVASVNVRRSHCERFVNVGRDPSAIAQHSSFADRGTLSGPSHEESRSTDIAGRSSAVRLALIDTCSRLSTRCHVQD
jgi:hypothetical protein